ncbi:hypothetical protein [Dyadobacter jiangsuensis]|nr:hypothetical protein [Dyadobacter jiangsuensis]
MEKDKSYEAKLEELLKDKERIYEIIRNSPALKRRNEKAAASLAKLPRPFPWEKQKSEANS